MKLKNKNIITIDGPSASGKGSLAKELARQLNFMLLDSGLLYRAYSYCFDQVDNHHSAMKLFSILEIDSINGAMVVFDNGQNITQALRSESVAISASKLSSQIETRLNLIDVQRALSNNNGLVADGRDMGTVVFPDAATKIFLSASSKERARRRHAELLPTNSAITLDSILIDLKARDIADKSREISPLIAAKDAFLIDSSNLSQTEVLDLALKHYTSCTKLAD